MSSKRGRHEDDGSEGGSDEEVFEDDDLGNSDEFEEDDIDEEEDTRRGRSSSKGKKQKVSRFVDVEATVGSDDDDEEEDDGGELADFIDDSDGKSRGGRGAGGPMPRALPNAAKPSAALAGPSHRFDLNEFESRWTAHEAREAALAAAPAQAKRAAGPRQYELDALSDDEEGSVSGVAPGGIRTRIPSAPPMAGGPAYPRTGAVAGDVAQQSQYPTVKDPKLFMVRCTTGKEREACISLMQKFVELRNTPQALAIKSALCVDGLKGHIYVEAHKPDYVQQAVRGLQLLRAWYIKLVPIREMTEVLAAGRKERVIKAKTWARVGRGLYKGDLCFIEDVDETRSQVLIKLVPRIDYKALAGGEDQPMDDERDEDKARRGGAGANAAKRKKKGVRPTQKFFNMDEVSEYSQTPEDIRDDRWDKKFTVWQNQKFLDGYLFKTVSYAVLDSEDAAPTLEELTMFEASGSSSADGGASSADALPMAASVTAARRKAKFSKGDTVIITEGDLKRLTATVERIDGEMIIIRPLHEELKELLKLPASTLAKHFRMGDHVKVITGTYAGETGHVVKVDNDILHILSDISKKEMRVFSQDVQETVDVNVGYDQLGTYSLFDLVTVNVDTVGVIVKVEKDAFRILDNNSEMRIIASSAIGQKRHTRGNATLDRNNNTVSQDSIVNIVEGPYKSRQATVKHVYKNILFCHARDVLENNGLFVTRSRSVEVIGGSKTGAAASGGYTRVPTASTGPGVRMPGAGAGGGGPRPGARDPLVHQVVRIVKGNFKGHLGTVKEVAGANYRVELQTQMKIVSLPRDSFMQEEKNVNAPATSSAFAAPKPYGDYGAMPAWGSTPNPYGGGGMTPNPYAAGDRTPAYGDRTPAYGDRTPAYGDRTPAYGDRTPAREDRTPAHSSSSYLSMLDSGSSSSAFGASPYFPPAVTAVGQNASTPHIPGYTPQQSAFTPSAPTPSMTAFTPYGQPSYSSDVYTPGLGGSGDASTPGQNVGSYGTPGQQTYGTPGAVHTPGMSYGTPGMGNYQGQNNAAGGASASAEETSNWFTTDVAVIISDEYAGGVYADAPAVIRAISGTGDRPILQVSINTEEGPRTLNVPGTFVTPDIPGMAHKNKKVKALTGSHRGEVGVLMTLNGGEAVVRFEDGNTHIVDVQTLALYGGA